MIAFLCVVVSMGFWWVIGALDKVEDRLDRIIELLEEKHK